MLKLMIEMNQDISQMKMMVDKKNKEVKEHEEEELELLSAKVSILNYIGLSDNR